MFEAIAAWKAGTWIGVLIFTSIAGGTIVKLFRQEPPEGKAAIKLLARAEADETLQHEMLAELKRLRQENASINQRLADLEAQLPAATGIALSTRESA